MIYALPPLILDKVRNTIDFSLTYFTWYKFKMWYITMEYIFIFDWF
jgi:hypothetical protein